jgi:hypothetical protein
MISSQPMSDPYSFPLQIQDVENGSLRRLSYIRPSYLFAADEAVISRKIGTLKADKLKQVVETVQRLIQ